MKDVKGFLSDKEAKKLQELFLKVHHLGSVLEIGTYCGKSALNFSDVAKDVNGLVYTIDHHTGSEEHQLGEEYHDSELFDERLKKFNTLPEFLNNLKSKKMAKFIIPIIDKSQNASKLFSEKISLLFIDGGHSFETALSDYNAWKDKICSEGLLVIHDVFPNPKDGGRPPYEIYTLARESKEFDDLGIYETLGILKKV
jgi:predicted O-methyltransferase YrrM